MLLICLSNNAEEILELITDQAFCYNFIGKTWLVSFFKQDKKACHVRLCKHTLRVLFVQTLDYLCADDCVLQPQTKWRDE